MQLAAHQFDSPYQYSDTPNHCLEDGTPRFNAALEQLDEKRIKNWKDSFVLKRQLILPFEEVEAGVYSYRLCDYELVYTTQLGLQSIDPKIKTNQDKQRPPPDPLMEHPAGVVLLYKLFGAVHTTRFTLRDSHCGISQRQAAATQIRPACPHEPTQSNETPHGNTSSDNHQPASPQ